MDRQEKANNLVTQAKEHFHNGDMAKAAKAWCEIYDLYENQTSIQGSVELHAVMARFSDNEVYGITGYLKEKYYRTKC